MQNTNSSKAPFFVDDRGVPLDMLCKRESIRIVIPAGKTRPVDPKIASRYASACSVAVRDVVPIFPHWKDYKEKGRHIFCLRQPCVWKICFEPQRPLGSWISYNESQEPYKTKTPFPEEQFFYAVQDKYMVVRTPPCEVGHMSEADWCKLVDNCSTPQKQVVSFFTQSCHQFYNLDYC